MGIERERERERERVPQGSLMINTTTAFLLFQWSTPKETFNCYAAAAAAAASASAVVAVAICLQVLTDPFM
jgi:hypothetical protein